jgi:cytochrome c oxidase subunit 2
MSAPGLACAGLAACGAAHDALDPAGDGAATIADLWWLIFWICVVVFVAVMAALLWAVLRARSRALPRAVPPELAGAPLEERRMGIVIGAAVGLTVVILFLFTVTTYLAARELYGHSGDGEISVELVGHQWWWEVRYTDPVPSNSFITANEIHVPVGASVKLKLTSPDVIHSFWVPNLTGKMDLIPGQENTTWITARRAGTYRGQCAEFCGLQHAHMALLVVAEDRAAFDGWAARQRQSAPEPTGDEEKRGKALFLAGPCVLCHSVRGTSAGATMGPDLTHVASRLTIGAGRLPNTPGHLAGWIVDPQGQKPGNQMPTNLMTGEELQAMLRYLATLQ